MKRKDQAFVQTFLHAVAVAAAGGLLALAGCSPSGGGGGGARRGAPQQDPSQQPPSQQAAQADPPLPTGQDVLAQAEAARKSALEFELLTGQLQEAPLSRQRPVLRQLFAKLAEALSNLAGPRRTGVFLHQYAVVLQVRDQLNNRPERLSDVGLVDDGLGAAYNALRDLSYAEYYADEELTKRMDALGSAVGRLRTAVQGPEHGLQVTDAVTRTSGVLTKMAGTFHERVKAGSAESATRPAATTQDAAPSTAPADPAATPAAPTPPDAAAPPATTPAPTSPAPDGTAPVAPPAPAPEGTPPVPAPAPEGTPAPAPADPAVPAPDPAAPLPAPAPGVEGNK